MENKEIATDNSKANWLPFEEEVTIKKEDKEIEEAVNKDKGETVDKEDANISKSSSDV